MGYWWVTEGEEKLCRPHLCMKELFSDFYVFIAKVCFSCSVYVFEKGIEKNDFGSFSSALKEKNITEVEYEMKSSDAF